jgi:hypothetical protein
MNVVKSRFTWFVVAESIVAAALLAPALASAQSALAVANAAAPMADANPAGGSGAAASKSSPTPRSTPRTPEGKPDFSGVWNGPGVYINRSFPDGKLPYTPAGEAAYRYNMTGAVDPQSLCIIIGQPRADLDAQPFEIVQTPKRVAFLYERDTNWRIIPVDGRQHPKDPEPSFFGDAVGSWDGDTFVVDLVGFKADKVWTDNVGHPQSDSLHLIERWTRPDADHLQLDLTIDDPKYYTKPIKITRNLKLQEYELIEFSCDENNLDRDRLGPGLGTKDGTRGYDRQVIQNLPPVTTIGTDH